MHLPFVCVRPSIEPHATLVRRSPFTRAGWNEQVDDAWITGLVPIAIALGLVVDRTIAAVEARRSP